MGGGPWGMLKRNATDACRCQVQVQATFPFLLDCFYFHQLVHNTGLIFQSFRNFSLQFIQFGIVMFHVTKIVIVRNVTRRLCDHFIGRRGISTVLILLRFVFCCILIRNSIDIVFHHGWRGFSRCRRAGFRWCSQRAFLLLSLLIKGNGMFRIISRFFGCAFGIDSSALRCRGGSITLDHLGDTGNQGCRAGFNFGKGILFIGPLLFLALLSFLVVANDRFFGPHLVHGQTGFVSTIGAVEKVILPKDGFPRSSSRQTGLHMHQILILFEHSLNESDVRIQIEFAQQGWQRFQLGKFFQRLGRWFGRLLSNFHWTITDGSFIIRIGVGRVRRWLFFQIHILLGHFPGTQKGLLILAQIHNDFFAFRHQNIPIRVSCLPGEQSCQFVSDNFLASFFFVNLLPFGGEFGRVEGQFLKDLGVNVGRLDGTFRCLGGAFGEGTEPRHGDY
mmetsp:Transcript_2642/g.7291  ORF Transcript_2642/g.7291 Transcript_2642/m.7291 type:complete len:446 (+) Transcript_2642:206-1543(+)